MIVPSPTHDVWMKFLAFLCESRSIPAVKTCILVCVAWRCFLRPKLLSTIIIDREHKTIGPEDLEVLRQFAPLVKHLFINDGRLMGGRNRFKLVPFPASFQHITDLRLHKSRIRKFGDLRNVSPL
jgi:hypothetical protein